MNRPRVEPTVLVAPLDWGLGHATRCIPIIKVLVAQNCKVIIAASGKVKSLLIAEFPYLKYIDLPGYNIRYAATGWGLPIKIVAQIPKLFFAIKKEQKWLDTVVKEEKIDAVISDNRYGLFHSKVISVFITHQLTIKAPFQFIEKFLQKTCYQYINHFTRCWIPDAEGAMNLGGELSHPKKKPIIPLAYIGSLSRFEKKENSSEKYLLVILSGPEPQRTILEKKLLQDLKNYSGPVVFIRGLPGFNHPITTASNVEVYYHLPAAELQEKISSASFVISRCGYSTVMDLSVLQKKSILIPTPGQTEQEYLAKHLMGKNFALCIAQKRFRLKNALDLAQTFPYQFETAKPGGLLPAIEQLLKEIKEKSESSP